MTPSEKSNIDLSPLSDQTGSGGVGIPRRFTLAFNELPNGWRVEGWIYDDDHGSPVCRSVENTVHAAAVIGVDLVNRAYEARRLSDLDTSDNEED